MKVARPFGPIREFFVVLIALSSIERVWKDWTSRNIVLG